VRRRTLRLISWNVNRRIGRLAQQAAALAAREPEVVALQEITETTLVPWREALAEMGMADIRCSLDDADAAREPRGPRRTGVLLAARSALGDVADPPPVPWSESVLAAVLDGVIVVAAHVPNAANGLVKPAMLRALHGWLAAREDEPRLLCGDLNTPRREGTGGEVWTFAQDARGRLRPERGETWDADERDVLLALPGMVDVFRSLNGYGPRDVSWTWRRWRGGYRLDHVLASPSLDATACAYHHEWRTDGLSDHSAIEAGFAAWPRQSRP